VEAVLVTCREGLNSFINQTRCAAAGYMTQLRVFVDPDLLQYDEVCAAAGTWNDNFGAAPADIVRVAGGVVTDLKRS
jgi:prolyl-tRNA editing enzyme YbaK/EbsC (Cys-tRNA(Pro) deacylase)